MPLRTTVKRRVLGCRLCLPALFTAGIATAAIVIGLLTGDMVTALGAFLLVPSAILLFAIGLKRETTALSDHRTH
ncbi:MULTISPECIES: hypothetical protein [Haloarcula]|jgi:hypothetical protein|uniref:Uncharacterized protein n=1 Tax=Haloarcula marismortui ATCC 33800 TaxID=662476 RepID=A0A8T8KL36_9EURY|nr:MULTISPECIES: hypothetical protein [Haloarcula]NHX41851.1 hypothetical protein [Haloarcula sp. R1-2]QUJ73815.1 hypothetical protein KDQ40_16465 [Haloarcula sinaiiensis ATCC 33800]RLM88745.1 hypothetical protein D3D01_20900 [Haloarcula sp. Atlit-7R]